MKYTFSIANHEASSTLSKLLEDHPSDHFCMTTYTPTSRPDIVQYGKSLIFFLAKDVRIHESDDKNNIRRCCIYFEPKATGDLIWSGCSFHEKGVNEEILFFNTTDDSSGFHLEFCLPTTDIVYIFHSASISGLIDELPIPVAMRAYQVIDIYRKNIDKFANDLDTHRQ